MMIVKMNPRTQRLRLTMIEPYTHPENPMNQAIKLFGSLPVDLQNENRNYKFKRKIKDWILDKIKTKC